MLYDRGLATEKDREDIEKVNEYRIYGITACVSSRICEGCHHLISDSTCLCIPIFTCPTCGYKNGEYLRYLASLPVIPPYALANDTQIEYYI